MSYDKYFEDPMQGDYEVACDHPGCGWTAKLRLNLGMKLQPGDRVYQDPSNEAVGKCRKCKRYSLKITKVPAPLPPDKPKGFWKIPES